MRLSEILRLVWLNLSQNKFKVILTSIGIVVGSATIMLVLAIGTGGKEEVAEQFKNLNAGAIDISCDSSDSGGFSFEMPGGGGSVSVTNMAGDPRGGSGGGMSGGPGGGMDFGGFFGFGQEEESEAVTLTSEDCDDLATFVFGNLCNYDILFHHSISGRRRYDLCFLLHHCRCGGQLCCHQ